jgi:hypothetical protein
MFSSGCTASLTVQEGSGRTGSNSAYCCQQRACASVGVPQSEAIRAALLSVSLASVTRSRLVAL